MRTSRSRYPTIRGLRHHLREWGEPGAPRLIMLHGWMDVSASFQFVVDELSREWHVIAPDWRGFGRSARAPGGYWFPDYLADLEALAADCDAREPLNLIGHSMGGNVAALYAGVRPGRVARLVLVDAFGLADHPAGEAPGRYQKWLNGLESAQPFRSYASRGEFARRLQAENPRLSGEQADYLAGEMVFEDAAGRFVSHGDPRHRQVNPVLYRREEAMACWRRALAPVLSIVPQAGDLRGRLRVSDEAHRQGQACFRDFRELEIADSGHNLHHDRPDALAAAIEAFVPFANHRDAT